MNGVLSVSASRSVRLLRPRVHISIRRPLLAVAASSSTGSLCMLSCPVLLTVASSLEADPDYYVLWSVEVDGYPLPVNPNSRCLRLVDVPKPDRPIRTPAEEGGVSQLLRPQSVPTGVPDRSDAVIKRLSAYCEIMTETCPRHACLNLAGELRVASGYCDADYPAGAPIPCELPSCPSIFVGNSATVRVPAYAVRDMQIVREGRRRVHSRDNENVEWGFTVAWAVAG